MRLALLAVLLLAGVAAGYLGYGTLVQNQATAPVQGQPVAVARGTIAARVNATGNIAPLAQSKLSFRSSGKIAQVLVKPGDAVVVGQPLVRLETRDLELALRNQELALRSAEVKLAQFQAGGRAEDVESAQASLTSAQAKLDAVRRGATAAEIESARSALVSAQTRLETLRKGPNAADVQSSQSAVVSARTNLVKAQNDLAKLTAPLSAEDLAQTAAALEKARGNLVKAQSDYDRIAWRGNVGATTEAQALASATADYEAARAAHDLKLQGAKPEDVANAQQAVVSAEAALQTAQANLDRVLAGTASEDITAAEASVRSAQANLNQVLAGEKPEDIAAAQASVVQASTGLALKQNPYTEVDVVNAEIAVEQAQAAVETARFNLDEAVLRAPFGGVVSAVNFAAGELAASGGNGVVVLVDPSLVRLDVTVDESDIGKLKVNQPAAVRFDALGTRTFRGTVSSIAPAATVQSGVATYLVSITLNNSEGALPGMTGTAEIVYDQKDNVLVVLSRAIRTSGRNRVVDVVQTDGSTREQTVRTGASDDQRTEIVEGLNEGDRVLIRSTTTRPGFVPGGAGIPGGFTGPVIKPGGR